MKGNKPEAEVVYTNDTYRVEKVGISDGENIEYIYAVISNIYGVHEVETKIMAQALNTADELEAAVNQFYQDKEPQPVIDMPTSEIITA